MKTDYVPRHFRLGVCLDLPEIECTHDVSKSVPVLDEEGNPVSFVKSLVSVPTSETIGKFDYHDFELKKMIDAGVPLKEMSVNRSLAYNLDNIIRSCESIDAADQRIKQFIEEKKITDNWFKTPDTIKSNEVQSNVEQ